MTVRPLTRAEVRSIDVRAAEEFGLPTLVLMENAGHGAARRLREACEGRRGPGRVVVACGPGNNGGDGGVVARFLDAWGYPVRVAWFARGGRRSADAEAQHRILASSGVDQATYDGPVDAGRLDDLFGWADRIVDGLLGTGLDRPVEGPLRDVIEAINRSGKPVFALDLPSGLDADAGMPLGVAVRARETATFVAPKAGFSAIGAERYTGHVDVVEIGAPRKLLEPFLV